MPRMNISSKGVSIALASFTAGMLLNQTLLPQKINRIFAEGEVTVVVRQVGEYTANWAILTPTEKNHTESSVRLHTFQGSAGNYTLILTEPPGHNLNTEVQVNDEVISESVSRTVSASIESGTLTFIIRVTPDYNDLGVVSVNSNPQGLSVMLKGPLETKTVTTPHTEINAVPGQWTAYVKLRSETCPDPKPMSQRLPENGGRASFTFTIDMNRCTALPTASLRNATSRGQARLARRQSAPSFSPVPEESDDIDPCLSDQSQRFQTNALIQQLNAADIRRDTRATRLERRSSYFRRPPPEGNKISAERPPRRRD
jgi:hypothetical protein